MKFSFSVFAAAVAVLSVWLAVGVKATVSITAHAPITLNTYKSPLTFDLTISERLWDDRINVTFTPTLIGDPVTGYFLLSGGADATYPWRTQLTANLVDFTVSGDLKNDTADKAVAAGSHTIALAYKDYLGINTTQTLSIAAVTYDASSLAMAINAPSAGAIIEAPFNLQLDVQELPSSDKYSATMEFIGTKSHTIALLRMDQLLTGTNDFTFDPFNILNCGAFSDIVYGDYQLGDDMYTFKTTVYDEVGNVAAVSTNANIYFNVTYANHPYMAAPAHGSVWDSADTHLNVTFGLRAAADLLANKWDALHIVFREINTNNTFKAYLNDAFRTALGVWRTILIDLEDPAASTNVIRTAGTLSDGTYEVYMTVITDTPVLVRSAPMTHVVVDRATLAPVIHSPHLYTWWKTWIDVTLPEPALADSIKVTITEPTGDFTAIWTAQPTVPNGLRVSGFVDSYRKSEPTTGWALVSSTGTPDLNDLTTVTITYQDQYGNAAVSSSVTGLERFDTQQEYEDHILVLVVIACSILILFALYIVYLGVNKCRKQCCNPDDSSDVEPSAVSTTLAAATLIGGSFVIGLYVKDWM